MVVEEGVTYNRDWWQCNKTIVFVVRCVYHIAFAGQGGRGILDMTFQVKL